MSCKIEEAYEKLSKLAENNPAFSWAASDLKVYMDNNVVASSSLNTKTQDDVKLSIEDVNSQEKNIPLKESKNITDNSRYIENEIYSLFSISKYGRIEKFPFIRYGEAYILNTVNHTVKKLHGTIKNYLESLEVGNYGYEALEKFNKEVEKNLIAIYADSSLSTNEKNEEAKKLIIDAIPNRLLESFEDTDMRDRVKTNNVNSVFTYYIYDKARKAIAEKEYTRAENILFSPISKLDKYGYDDQRKLRTAIEKKLTDVGYNVDDSKSLTIDMLDKLYANIHNSKVETQNQKQSNKKDTLQLEIYGKEAEPTTGYSEYSQLMVDMVDKTVKPLRVEDQQLAIKALLRGLDKVIVGQYDPSKNEIKIAAKPNPKLIETAAKEHIDSVYFDYIQDLDIPDEKLLSYMENDPLYKKLQSNVKEVVQELSKHLDTLLGEKASLHAVVHEYIHAGAVNYMRNNPNSIATKRIEEMYKKAMSPRYKSVIDKHFVGMEDSADYWRSGVDEFLAEALSNPRLMAGLNEIKVENMNTISTVFKSIYDAVMRMLGMSKNDSVYKYTLDGYMAMIEAQKDANEITKQDPTYIPLPKSNALNMVRTVENTNFSQELNDKIKDVLQKLYPEIKGQANIEAGTVLINSLLQSQDTLPHEYAHHYIAWFRDAPIVQEAIKKWGSEEALVQAIGEQVVKQKGEAYTWWKQFTKWLQDKFNKLSNATKEELRDSLTNAFLTREDLHNRTIAVDAVIDNLTNRYPEIDLSQLKGLETLDKINAVNGLKQLVANKDINLHTVAYKYADIYVNAFKYTRVVSNAIHYVEQKYKMFNSEDATEKTIDMLSKLYIDEITYRLNINTNPIKNIWRLVQKAARETFVDASILNTLNDFMSEDNIEKLNKELGDRRSNAIYDKSYSTYGIYSDNTEKYRNRTQTSPVKNLLAIYKDKGIDISLEDFANYADTIFPDSKIPYTVTHSTNYAFDEEKEGSLYYSYIMADKNLAVDIVNKAIDGNYKFEQIFRILPNNTMYITKNIADIIAQKGKRFSFIFRDIQNTYEQRHCWAYKEKFSKDKIGSGVGGNYAGEGFYFYGLMGAHFPGYEIVAKLNIHTLDTRRFGTGDGYIGPIPRIMDQGKEIVVKEPEQIHVFGSIEDIKNLQSWLDNGKPAVELAAPVNGDSIKLFSEFKLADGKHITYNFNPQSYGNRVGPVMPGAEGDNARVQVIGKYSDDKMAYRTVKVMIDDKVLTHQPDGTPLHITDWINTEAGIKPYMTGQHAKTSTDIVPVIYKREDEDESLPTLAAKVNVVKGTYNEKFDRTLPSNNKAELKRKPDIIQNIVQSSGTNVSVDEVQSLIVDDNKGCK